MDWITISIIAVVLVIYVIVYHRTTREYTIKETKENYKDYLRKKLK